MRTLSLLSPTLALYFAVELFIRAPAVDATGTALAIAGALLSLAPLVFLRGVESRGIRRLAVLSSAAALGLITIAQPGVLSGPLEIAAALAWPPIGALIVSLALDTPDQPQALARAHSTRAVAYASAALATAIGLLLALPPVELGGGLVLVPASLVMVIPAISIAQLTTALAVRLARRRLGSTPEALASNGWALLAIALALPLVALAAAITWLGLERAESSSLARGLVCAAVVALVLGHAAMLDARRPIHAARALRTVLAGILAALTLGGALAWAVDAVPRTELALATGGAAFLAAGTLAFQIWRALIESIFAPDRGRLLQAIAEAETAMLGARTLDELAAAVLPPLRRAARTLEARPVIWSLVPGRELSVDAAGLPKVLPREPSPAVIARLMERPGEIVVAAPVLAQSVRRPELRALADVIRAHDALCVLPIILAGELEGALVLARGRRRAPLTLEEIAALESLATRIAASLATHLAELRAADRAGKALIEKGKLEERIDALEEELSRLRAETRALSAGRAADRLVAPAIAYSAAMRALVAKVQEVAPVEAPLALLGESGTAVETIAQLVHGASARRHGPFVVADCASVRPERTAAALLGEASPELPADDAHPGWLRLATGGTLLLVDAPALSREAQHALVEAIATRAARPEASASQYRVDLRLIVHSRIDIQRLARAGTLDLELAERLAPLRLVVPPLRNRREDLPSLVLLALDRACRTLGKNVMGIDDQAMQMLVEHSWPGNLRQLQSVIDRAVLIAKGIRITAADLPHLAAANEQQGPAKPAADPFGGTWNEIEQRALRAVLEKTAGNKSEAARMLGLPRTTLLDKLRKAGLEGERISAVLSATAPAPKQGRLD